MSTTSSQQTTTVVKPRDSIRESSTHSILTSREIDALLNETKDKLQFDPQARRLLYQVTTRCMQNLQHHRSSDELAHDLQRLLSPSFNASVSSESSSCSSGSATATSSTNASSTVTSTTSTMEWDAMPPSSLFVVGTTTNESTTKKKFC